MKRFSFPASSAFSGRGLFEVRASPSRSSCCSTSRKTGAAPAPGPRRRPSGSARRSLRSEHLPSASGAGQPEPSPRCHSSKWSRTRSRARVARVLDAAGLGSTLSRATIREISTLSGMGDWQHGKTPDRKSTERNRRRSAASFPGRVPPGDALDQLAQLYPFVAELREASTTRPFFRIAQTYEFIDNPKESDLRLLTDQIGVSKHLDMGREAGPRRRENGPSPRGHQAQRAVGSRRDDQPMLVCGLV